MSTRKKTTSESGAFMSKYDVEVESRLQKLEAQTHTPCGGGSSSEVEERLASLESKFEILVATLKANPKNNIEKLSKGLL